MAEVNEKELEEVVGGEKLPQYDPNKCYGKVVGQGPHKGYQCKKYKVAVGDTLSAIALNHTVDQNYYKLAKFNDLENPSLIYAEQIIYCPIGAYLA